MAHRLMIDDLHITLGTEDMDLKETLIHDIRGEESNYKLDEYGFKIIKHTTAVQDFSSDEDIKTANYAEVGQLMKNRCARAISDMAAQVGNNVMTSSFGATKVIIFNHMIREGHSPLVDPDGFSSGKPGPAPRIHLDQTPLRARQALSRILTPPEVSEITSRPWQILNHWHPLRIVQKDPFAVADARTVTESDRIASKQFCRPGNIPGKNCTAKGDGVDKHRWYYLNQQKIDEVLMFKQHDSEENAVARGVPHSSFNYPGGG
jgi:hypothetical protein